MNISWTWCDIHLKLALKLKQVQHMQYEYIWSWHERNNLQAEKNIFRNGAADTLLVIKYTVW
jgi:hypothetical protein